MGTQMSRKLFENRPPPPTKKRGHSDTGWIAQPRQALHVSVVLDCVPSEKGLADGLENNYFPINNPGDAW